MYCIQVIMEEGMQKMLPLLIQLGQLHSRLQEFLEPCVLLKYSNKSNKYITIHKLFFLQSPTIQQLELFYVNVDGRIGFIFGEDQLCFIGELKNDGKTYTPVPNKFEKYYHVEAF